MGLNRNGGLFDLDKTMVSVLHEELEYKAVKLMFKKVGGHTQPRIRIKCERPVDK